MVPFFILCWLVAPQAALACPVCFGDPSSPMTSGMNLAILTLLGITTCVLAAFGGFFVYLIRRAKMAARANDPPGASYQTQRGMLTVKVFLVGTEGRR